MKKFYVGFTIFLFLICISSFSYCASSTIASQVDYSSSGLTISVPNCDFDSIATWSKEYLVSNNYDLTNTPYCFAGVYESNQILVVWYNTYEIAMQREWFRPRQKIY